MSTMAVDCAPGTPTLKRSHLLLQRNINGFASNEKLWAKKRERHNIVVYHLLHYHGETDLVDRDCKSLGFYSSIEEARKAIQVYRTLPGFSDYINGFCINEHYVIGYKDPDDEFICPVGATLWERTYADCFEFYLDVFGNSHNAELYLDRFKK